MEKKKGSKRHVTNHYSNVLLFDHASVDCLEGIEIAHCNPITIEKPKAEETDKPVKGQGKTMVYLRR